MTTTRLIRCRLSDGIAAAVEFTASDPASLRQGCERAVARYAAEHGTRRWPLELQVRPLDAAQQAIGWFAPLRGLHYVVVYVSPALLERRPADDWGDLWEWVEASRAHDRALAGFVNDVAGWIDEEAAGD